jgi:hypothetical protein
MVEILACRECVKAVCYALAKLIPCVETVLDVEVEDTVLRCTSNDRNVISLSVIILVQTSMFLLEESGNTEGKLVNIDEKIIFCDKW